ncbi:Gfo/Idh/MocA family protein [Tropicimonas sp. IMCC34011]|uniref:Gfo/Idh/MocA family protein n=1 Tax=Tropicimonas sp. IMCC34011 TaxID=2248759 RepID=UPI000E238EA5|nr:Gfo/Idh/MocA family oxidoreductase [Tropicimonas sp. IMCC34011]
MTPAPLALLGAAHPHVADYLRVIAEDGTARITHVWDDEPDLRGEVARASGALICPPEDFPPDLAGILICSETRHHARDVDAVLRLGCPLFVEKPLAIDPDPVARRIVDGGTRFHTGFFLRTYPALAELAHRLRAGALGEVSFARIRFTHDGLRAGWLPESHWLADPERASTSPFGDLALHAVDLLSWLGLGPLDSGHLRQISILGRGIADTGIATLPLRSGIAEIETGWADLRTRLDIEVLGTRGGAWCEDGTLLLREGDGPAIQLGRLVPDAGRGIRPFLHAIGTGNWEGCVSPADAIRASNVIARLERRAPAK